MGSRSGGLVLGLWNAMMLSVRENPCLHIFHRTDKKSVASIFVGSGAFHKRQCGIRDMAPPLSFWGLDCMITLGSCGLQWVSQTMHLRYQNLGTIY